MPRQTVRCCDVMCGEREPCEGCPVAKTVLSASVSHQELKLEVDGETRHIYATSMPIKSHDNHVDGVVAHARRVQRSGTRMRRLVGDLVDVASIEAGSLAVTRAVGDPADVVMKIYAMSKQGLIVIDLSANDIKAGPP